MIVRSLILLLFIWIVPIDGLQCYNCQCLESDTSTCDCDSITTDSYPVDYCVIIETRTLDDAYIELTRVPRNASWLHVDDYYYLLAVESIRYNLTTADWFLFTTGIIYGCDWDLCNDPSYIDVLPNSFTLSIDKTWLDTNIYGTGSVDSCYDCQGGCFNQTYPFDPDNCPLTNCTSTTSVIDTQNRRN